MGTKTTNNNISLYGGQYTSLFEIDGKYIESRGKNCSESKNSIIKWGNSLMEYTVKIAKAGSLL